jgi:thioredoxin reductase
VPGETLPHVAHHLEDPVEHDGERIIIVGGGDVALEAALALAERPNTTVTLCHRGESFDRAKPANQDRLAETPSITVLCSSEIDVIAPAHVTLRTPDGPRTVEADRVFIMIGSDLPTDLFATSGIRVQTHRGDISVQRVG